jgi:RNA polymerase sigma-70 factor (ECF subfamily)
MHEQPMELTEASLRRTVERARRGDPDAWEALYRRAYPGLFAYARRRLATEEQAEDAVSEVMTRALHRIAAFTWDGAGVDGWLFGIARNVVLEAYRRGARTTATDPQVLAADPTAASAGGADPAEQVVAGEERRLVRLAFDRLTEQDRELLELRVVVGLGSDAVGAITGRTAGAVRMAQSRALQRLRGEYEALAR